MRPSDLAFAAVLSASLTNAAYLDFPEEYKRDDVSALPSKTVEADIGRMPFVTGSISESFPTPVNFDQERFVKELRSWASEYLADPASAKEKAARSTKNNSTDYDIFEQFLTYVTPYFVGKEGPASSSAGAKASVGANTSPKKPSEQSSKGPGKDSSFGLYFPDPFELMDIFTKIIAGPFSKRDFLEEAFQNALGSVTGLGSGSQANISTNATIGASRNATSNASRNSTRKGDKKKAGGMLLLPLGVAGNVAGKVTEGAGKATSAAGSLAQKAGLFTQNIASSFFKREAFDGAYRGRQGLEKGLQKGLDIDEGSFYEGGGCSIEDLKKSRAGPGKEQVTEDP